MPVPNFAPALSSRRTFLKGLGVTLALPWLESLGGLLHASEPGAEPRRLLLITVPLGLYRQAFVPAIGGSGYESTEYLKVIEAFRDRYTIISGLDHPGVGGGHSANPRIFTGRPSEERNACSLDQYLGARIGLNNRFDSLGLNAGAGDDIRWSESGAPVPDEKKVSAAYAKLFSDDAPGSRAKIVRELGNGRSIVDFVAGEARALQPRLSARDRDKLDEYFESVRATERRLLKSEEWLGVPKPRPGRPAPEDPVDPTDIITNLRNVCDLTYLAFKTDSTRVVTFGYFRQGPVAIPGVNKGYHNLSHHGQVEEDIATLKLVERAFFEELNTLLANLAATKEGDATLLDRTTILVTSPLGNGSNHSNKNLPVLLLGGRFRHGQHLAFAPGAAPLSNLFVSILNQCGLPDKSFATSTGRLCGLDFV